ncbi:hypothetical protein CHELA17_64640 [Chelatococcus asaccharovorans]|nr:hypothetical protein CHELA17_64640 [Chelatococcus asaccharovorans]
MLLPIVFARTGFHFARRCPGVSALSWVAGPLNAIRLLRATPDGKPFLVLRDLLRDSRALPGADGGAGSFDRQAGAAVISQHRRVAFAKMNR